MEKFSQLHFKYKNLTKGLKGEVKRDFEAEGTFKAPTFVKLMKSANSIPTIEQSNIIEPIINKYYSYKVLNS